MIVMGKQADDQLTEKEEHRLKAEGLVFQRIVDAVAQPIREKKTGGQRQQVDQNEIPMLQKVPDVVGMILCQDTVSSVLTFMILPGSTRYSSSFLSFLLSSLSISRTILCLVDCEL